MISHYPILAKAHLNTVTSVFHLRKVKIFNSEDAPNTSNKKWAKENIFSFIHSRSIYLVLGCTAAHTHLKERQ